MCLGLGACFIKEIAKRISHGAKEANEAILMSNFKIYMKKNYTKCNLVLI